MSMSESTLSQASTKVDDDTKDRESDKPRSFESLRYTVRSTTAQDILLFLVAFRILNALTVRTFFQPDEFFQSLEPAWQTAFGKNSGAWITWASTVLNAPAELPTNGAAGMEEPPTITDTSFNLRSRLLWR